MSKAIDDTREPKIWHQLRKLFRDRFGPTYEYLTTFERFRLAALFLCAWVLRLPRPTGLPGYIHDRRFQLIIEADARAEEEAGATERAWALGAQKMRERAEAQRRARQIASAMRRRDTGPA